MFKSLKIKAGVSKSDCCSITIQEVKDSQEDSLEENKDCCEITVETKQSCCS
ncbi:hypothetical protein [Bacillus sp. V3-13]|uniref:hypothetical protein n=1 Tax=Bacillus sp. V3-13 TaxID=2053728 RepID=UPI0015E11E46|nr:hypothetical protein [Bacillus sp. V3-13]